jgi:hypothetical protein
MSGLSTALTGMEGLPLIMKLAMHVSPFHGGITSDLGIVF